ncbi:protein of unknown function DUF29 [Stanieria cyanosphaera PCC 7437]|uniref:DUF29 domain-containing protein n=1 Tax=Stanieria cyanosphaera (strain ATCC 29371 / PCC 7437) TaxID=111780 RepID=K9XX47_STAC7|nr:DUF29 domain-containing protein [Stanieria cyanosphaera]AFZ36666.1 protein of unknown function DUF29 [Stanieria cyanosphaera PCC 7437]
MINYNQDYAAWLEMTAILLKQKMFASIDWDNLIEEIEDLGKSQKRAVESLLVRLLEHLLKLQYWQEEKDRCGNHWKSEIVNFRYQILKRLKESPSLKKHLEGYFEEAKIVASQSVSQLTDLPDNIDLKLEDVLKE